MKEVKEYRVENSNIVLPANKIKDYVLFSGNCIAAQRCGESSKQEKGPKKAIGSPINNMDKCGENKKYEIVLLSVADVQKILGIGKTKAYSLFGQKDFPSFRIDNRYYVKKEKFEKWIDEITLLPNRCYEIVC